MSNKEVVIRRDIQGESFDVMVGDETIATLNHDRHGWDGMEAAQSLVEKLGEKLGFEVRHEEGGDESEDDDEG